MWDETTYPCPNFSDSTLEFGNGFGKLCHPKIQNERNYLTMLEVKLNHTSKEVPVATRLYCSEADVLAVLRAQNISSYNYFYYYFVKHSF